MMRPRTLALVDAIVTVLRDEHGTPDEIAARIGNVACKCWESGSPGVGVDAKPCWCAQNLNGAHAGWRPAGRHDVFRLLVLLRTAGMVERYPDPRGSKSMTWALVKVRADDGLETVWDLPANERRS